MQTQTRDLKKTPRRWAAAAIAVAVVAAAIAVAMMNGNSGEKSLELSLGESNATASCLAFDTAVLAGMPVAFEGTVTSVDGATATLSVDRWFKGGDAETVTLVGGHESAALIAGFEFQPGATYLISASEGNVNYCGYSGASSAELLAGFEAAFAG